MIDKLVGALIAGGMPITSARNQSPSKPLIPVPLTYLFQHPGCKWSRISILEKALFCPMETDHVLLNAARRMDEEALVKIFDLYSSALFNYALRLCGDPVRADHIVGDVFSKLLDQIAAGNGPTSNVRSYLYEMAYHQIVDEARRSKRMVPLELADTVGQDTHSAFLRVEDEITFKQILHLLRTELTVDQRHVIVLRFLEEFSIRETAAIMGKTVEHVKVIQNRAIAALRRSLEQREFPKAKSSSRIRSLSKAFGI